MAFSELRKRLFWPPRTAEVMARESKCDRERFGNVWIIVDQEDR